MNSFPSNEALVVTVPARIEWSNFELQSACIILVMPVIFGDITVILYIYFFTTYIFFTLGARGKYVDVMSSGKDNTLAPAPAALFNVMPKSASMPAKIFVPAAAEAKGK